MIKVDEPENASRVAKAIDERFANSSDETITQTEQFVQTEIVTWMGNIKLILMTVGAIVFFTLLLVTGSTMAMTIRERTGEIGVLKTLGFSDLLVLALVLSESLAYALAGGGLGLALAKLYTLGGDPTKGMLRIFYLSPGNIAAGILITIATGLAAGIFPAVNAMRLNIVTALRRV
jgi:putative ABC transport system permease protein